MLVSQERLEGIVGDKGEVLPLYGGYEVKVLEPEGFPWYEVFRELLGCKMEVWVRELKEEGILSIHSKPRPT